jgi:hypothetical protein
MHESEQTQPHRNDHDRESDRDPELDFMPAQQERYPAVVVDRHWNLLKANAGAVRMMEFLVGPLTPGAAVNLADVLVGPDVLRPHLVNWADVVRHFIRSIESDAAADGLDESAALLERLLAYRGVRKALRTAAPNDARSPVLPMHFRKDGRSLQLFTTIATLGTPPGRYAAGAPYRVLLPDERRDRDAAARLGETSRSTRHRRRSPRSRVGVRQLARASSSRTAAGRGMGAMAV